MAETEKAQAPAQSSGPKKVKVELLAILWRQPVGDGKYQRRNRGDVFEVPEYIAKAGNANGFKPAFKVLDS